MITKFEALVSRESLSEVYASDGQSVTVVKIREARGTWIVLVEYSDGSRAYRMPGNLAASGHLLELIKNRTYREDTMTWHAVIDGERVVMPLHY